MGRHSITRPELELRLILLRAKKKVKKKLTFSLDSCLTFSQVDPGRNRLDLCKRFSCIIVFLPQSGHCRVCGFVARSTSSSCQVALPMICASCEQALIHVDE